MGVNAVNSMGLTAIHGAANRGSDDIIRFLVARGAKLDVKDKEGRTPLNWAGGVFLATHPAKPKPVSMALISWFLGLLPSTTILPTGTIMAPPIPWRIRARMNWVSPVDTPQKTDAMVKTAIATPKTVRAP